jgi:hypothetical protein
VQELKKATDKVREALAREKKTDSARFHAMVLNFTGFTSTKVPILALLCSFSRNGAPFILNLLSAPYTLTLY